MDLLFEFTLYDLDTVLTFYRKISEITKTNCSSMRWYHFEATLSARLCKTHWEGFFMKLSLIEVSFSRLNENLFFLKLHNKSHTTNVFYGTIHPSNPAQFQFFPHPVIILAYCFSDGFQLELRDYVSSGVDNLKKHIVYIFTGFVVLTKGTKLFKW